MFIRNFYGSIVNTAHIITVGVQEPMYEQKDHTVIASLTRGTTVLYRGTKERCETYLANLETVVSFDEEDR